MSTRPRATTMRANTRATSRANDLVLKSGGEIGRLMREVDWSATALGPMNQWKQSLWSAISICLASRFPIVMYWGPELTVIYNDAYSKILGAKHPWALGKPCAVCWAEIWDKIGPMLEGVVTTGEATWSDDLELRLERSGSPEECYFCFSFSPVRVENGEVGGVFTAVVETTHRVLSDRRLRILAEVGARGQGATTVEEVCERCIEAVGSTRDVPFAALYLRDDLRPPRLAATTDMAVDSFWLLGKATQAALGTQATQASTQLMVPVDPNALRAQTRWPADVAPKHAIVLPINASDAGRPAGHLVAGVNPLRPLDDDFRAFFDLLARQISGAITHAEAYQSERRRAEALEDLDRAKTEFFSNVSHEFRTPLTLLLGPLDSLAAAAEPGTEQAEQLELARRNALRLLKLVNTVLDFSRIDAIRHEASLEPVDLGAYTAELAGVFRSAIEAAGLRLVLDCRPLDAPVFIDREMWEKVVLNLVSNALKFTTDGEIAIRVAKRDGRAEVTVADTGAGIAADVVPHIFDRFYRVRDAQSRTHEGAGIGLALVKELVEIMGGDIHVSSVPGVGSTFTVALPLGADHIDSSLLRRTDGAARTQVPDSYVAEALGWIRPALSESSNGVNAASGEPHKARILVVDDNADMRAYIDQLLREHWEVEAVTDGVAARDAIRRQRPDLVLTDVMMPRMDGLQLLSALRSDVGTRDIPIVVLSARAGVEASIDGLMRGADDYVAKPFTAAELIARVDANLARASMRNELARARAEVQLAAERNSFLNMAAHELRSPLTVIGGYVELVLNGTLEPGSEPARAALQKVALKTQEGVKLVEQMLMTARMEAGKLHVKMAQLDLAEVVEDAVTRAAPLASLERKSVAAALGDKTVRVRADKALVALIVDNLVANAIFHGGDSITVEVADNPEGIRVVDSGAGIAAEARERIFEPFIQLEAHMPLRSGVGLGLAVSRRVAELQGGSLALESTEHGTSFLLTLPAARRRSLRSSAPRRRADRSDSSRP